MNFDQLKYYLTIAFTFALSYLVIILGGKMYVLLVFNQLSESDAAIFAFSTRLMELLLLPMQAISTVLLPLLIKNKKSGDEIYTNVMTLSVYSYALISIVFSYFQFPVLDLLIDNPAEISQFVANYILIAPMIAAYSVSSVFYIALGENKIILIRSVLFLVFSLFSGVLMIENFGLNGVIYSCLATYLLIEVVTYFYSSMGKCEIQLRVKSFMGIFKAKKVIVELHKITKPPA